MKIDQIKRSPFTLYISGGLGNQMFQYATAYSYGKKFNREMRISTDSYFGYEWNKYCGFAIDHIVNNLNISSPEKWTVFFLHGKVSKLIGRILKKIFWQKGRIFKEKDLFIFDPTLLNNDYYDGLSGYFQSPLYFEFYNKEILSIYKLPISSNQALELKETISNTESSVAIHYRDYGELASGNEAVKNLFGDISIQYYKEAISIMDKRIEKPRYFIFSNNINSAKEKFSKINDITFFDYKSIYEWEDMALMSICKHNIICNSSYSWWAAYLNKNPNKIVIAPKSWGNLLKGKENNNNLFPINWELI